MSGRADTGEDTTDEPVTDGGTHEVTLEHEGEEITLSVDEDEYILDAAEEAGLDLPYSCRKGQCTSCVGTVEAGEIDQSEGAALDPMQEDDGFALLCITYPKSDCTIETDTQSDMFGGDMDIL
ncbi:2Fe-2S iron-sulfur cluster-binding protein [Halorientalis pallida]|uniref:2Fe-2S iron-sulfur cluster binding domain-containing protein n=1 Tax=Halorientalis pallida TaxID=2479928 RepID=A0A498KTT8_9EURY|nr:2Fe-2S iron-sulfur cluster-binding protein [Halorientalis pallida]RXK48431.1 2Fe-2S iron-sulfur cluster binding domain-containing protein [Halorientalis pallida]